MNAMPADSANHSHTPLDEDTQRLLKATTARLVNHAVERRVDSVVKSSAAEQRLGQRLWPLALGAAVLVLVLSIAWLMRGAGH
jgi:hypothetical protein